MQSIWSDSVTWSLLLAALYPPGETEQMLRQILLMECDEPRSVGKYQVLQSSDVGVILCAHSWRGLDKITEVK